MSEIFLERAPSATLVAEVFAPTYPLPRVEMVSGCGSFVTDARGVTYLDFVSGIAVNAFGHAPEGLRAAVTRQMGVLGHVSNLYGTEPGTTLARRLAAAAGYDRVFFCNSGTEGVEGALKFARAYAGHRGRAGRGILAFHGGFHGRTGLALSATANASYRKPFEPLVPGVVFGAFNDVEALDALIDDTLCAVIVEPVQGEAGALVASPLFLRTLRTLTAGRGVTLIFDEVQCGMGRTGTFLAAEQYGVTADMTVLSKALAGGLPLGAVLMTEGIAEALKPGMHGSTFGGGPVAAAAANWVVGEILAPGFLESVQRKALLLDESLKALVARHPELRARGLGLLRAVDIGSGASYDAPGLVAEARHHKLLLVRGGDTAVRLLPPLNVSENEITLGLERLEAAITSLESRKGS